MFLKRRMALWLHMLSGQANECKGGPGWPALTGGYQPQTCCYRVLSQRSP
jgi:hypothetical protein